METDWIPVLNDLDVDIEGLLSDLDCAKEECSRAAKKIGKELSEASLLRSAMDSAAIEGNTLSYRQVAAISKGEYIEAPFDELTEIKDAVDAYRLMPSLRTWSVEDFLEAHDAMTFGLLEKPGFRDGAVGIFRGRELIYRPPEHEKVPPLVEKLFQWGSESDLPAPVTASVAHFYIEAVHPFFDGNGKMGRLWTAKILRDNDPVYGIVPFESFIRRGQQEYYRVLQSCQSVTPFDCTGFVRFNLECIVKAFEQLSEIDPDDIRTLLDALGDEHLTIDELLTRTGCPDWDKMVKGSILPALDLGLIDHDDWRCYRVV